MTGLSIMRMERGLDTGPVYATSSVMIRDNETAGELHDRLAPLGARLLASTLPAILNGEATPEPQPADRATYARMLTSGDRNLTFSAAGREVAWRINGLTPWPGVSFWIGGEELQPVRARGTSLPAGQVPGTLVACSAEAGLIIACAEGTGVEILSARKPGKREMPSRDLLRGARWNLSSTLSTGPSTS